MSALPVYPATCAICGEPFSPVSGHMHTPTLGICGPCARDYLKWVKSHTKRRWGGENFYEHAATSVRPPVEPVKPAKKGSKRKHRRT